MTTNKNESGYFGPYGGQFVPEHLAKKLNQLYKVFSELKQDKAFNLEYISLLKNYVGRPSPLFKAENLSEIIGSTIYLKREDLNHTGSHKINNAIGQILLAKRMGAREIIAETGAGQHGVATATAASLMGIKCKIFIGKVDSERQKMNVERIKLLGAEVVLAASGTGTLKDAVDEALNYYVENPNAFYLLGSAVGPHPYPEIVRHFQSVISKEIKQQIFDAEQRLPQRIIACIGGGSNAIGAFSEFLNEDVILDTAEGGGRSFEIGHTAATLNLGKEMIFQGSFSLCLQDEKGNAAPSYSIAAGLDYPGIGPEHAYLKSVNRVNYHVISDQEAIYAYRLLAEKEGIIPAIESAHAIALAIKLLKNKNELAVINLSGRGDKDVARI
ncbi:MAG: tryptophan synthase subunit beta [Bacteroidales bacterium]|nr:tryptophan synthase subunit beta [Bacteroidales bacterium]